MLVGPPVSALLWPTWQSLDADVDMLGQYLLTVQLGYLIAWPITLAAAVVFAFLLDPAYSMLQECHGAWRAKLPAVRSREQWAEPSRLAERLPFSD